MPSKTIVFDFGGVLIDWNPRNLYKKIFSSETEMEWFLENICTTEWNLRIDAGKPFAVSVAERSSQYPEWTAEIEAFHKRWPEMLGGEIPGTVEILEEIIQKGYKVYGLTNWSAETFPIAQGRYPSLNLMDGIVVSGEEKLIKPDPEIFRVLLEKYNLNAENCIFIDDNLHNIEASRKLGFEAIHYKDPDGLRDALSWLGVL